MGVKGTRMSRVARFSRFGGVKFEYSKARRKKSNGRTKRRRVSCGLTSLRDTSAYRRQGLTRNNFTLRPPISPRVHVTLPTSYDCGIA